MMKTFLIFIPALLLVACDQRSQALNQLSDQAVILAFGDSLTYGTGASPQHNYPRILSHLSGRQVINAGKPGEISQDGLRRLPALLDKIQPELLILIHGGNDMLRKIPASQTQENLRKMIAESKRRHIDVVLIGVPSPRLFLLSSAELYQQLAESFAIPCDLETLPEILGKPAMKSDMIHPNDLGYQRLAENIYRLLKEQGAF